MDNRVQIYLTTYNRQKYLPDSIRSVLNQTYRDFQLVILDNCSTDDTEAIVKSFSDERIRYIRHSQNIGGAENLSYAFRYATSKYFVVFHDDDIMKPDFIEKELAVLEAHPEISVVTGLADYIDPEGEFVKQTKNRSGEVTLFSGKQLFDTYMNQNWPIVFPTAMYRRDFVSRNQLLPVFAAGPCGDVVLFFEIERHGGTCAVIQEALVNYRTHPTQDSTVFCASMLEELFRYLQSEPYYRSLLDNVVDKQSSYYRELMRRAICLTSDKKMTLEEFYEAAPRYHEAFTADKMTRLMMSFGVKVMQVCPQMVRFCYICAKAIKRKLKK